MIRRVSVRKQLNCEAQVYLKQNLGGGPSALPSRAGEDTAMPSGPRRQIWPCVSASKDPRPAWGCPVEPRQSPELLHHRPCPKAVAPSPRAALRPHPPPRAPASLWPLHAARGLCSISHLRPHGSATEEPFLAQGQAQAQSWQLFQEAGTGRLNSKERENTSCPAPQLAACANGSAELRGGTAEPLARLLQPGARVPGAGGGRLRPWGHWRGFQGQRGWAFPPARASHYLSGPEPGQRFKLRSTSSSG